MKLRLKTLLIVGTTLVLLLAAIGLVARAVLLGGFARVERADAERNVKRFEDAVAAMVDNLAVKAADWAKWDDTYRFVVDRNEAYVESNLADETLVELEIGSMLFLDQAGMLVFGRALDPEAEVGGPVPPAVLAAILGEPRLTRHQDEESVTAGILRLPTGAVAVTSRPVLKSTGEGPIRGTIVFTQPLDEDRIARLGELTHLEVAAADVGATDLEPDMASALARLGGSGPIIEPRDGSRIAGYTLLKDIEGRPVLVARVLLARDIYRQGLGTMVYLLLSVVVAGMAFGAAILVLLGRTVVSRVARLDADVGIIESSADRSRRVEAAGRDEIGALGRSINSMLDSLERAEAEVRSRSRQMRLIMDSVPAGLLSVDESGRVGPEHSRSAARILGRDEIAGCDIFELLGIDGRQGELRHHLEGYFDVLRRRLLPLEDAAGLNPCTEHLLQGAPDGRERWLRVGFVPIDREDGHGGDLLAVVEDISEEKAMQARAAQSERENMQLKVIAEDPELFREFLAETTRILRHAREQLEALGSPATRAGAVNEIFRDVHTVKGTSSSFGLSALAEAAGAAEEQLAAMRKSERTDPGDSERVRDALEVLEAALAAAVDGTRGILGDEPLEGGATLLRISTERLQETAEEVDGLIAQRLTSGAAATAFRETIRKRLLALRAVPAKRGLARSLRIVPGLASRLGKNVRFTLAGEETLIDYAVARELNTPIVHLVRNAFDHGIEDPHERRARGKPESGEVRVTVERTEAGLTVSVRDDGRGLDPRRLVAVAVARGLINREEADKLKPADALALVYRPGFSTSESVTEVSGRGVGLDAVRASVERLLRGKVSIATEVGKSTTFTLRIPDPA